MAKRRQEDAEGGGALDGRYHVSQFTCYLSGRFCDRREYAEQSVDSKPQGVWWGVGASWMEWCEGEEFDVGGAVYSLEVREDRLVTINDADALDAFHARFAAAAWTGDRRLRAIDWAKVAEQWDGIEITPYLWERRFDKHAVWYYGWDCASGVTWRPSRVIRSVRYIGDWTAGHIPAEVKGHRHEEYAQA